MINSQRENKSIYEAMFDQAIKDMNKHTSNHVKNIGQSINSSQNEKAANNIVLITKLIVDEVRLGAVNETPLIPSPHFGGQGGGPRGIYCKKL